MIPEAFGENSLWTGKTHVEDYGIRAYNYIGRKT